MTMKRLGYLLLVLGFLGATYLASLDPLAVNWVLFPICIIGGFAGVLLVRRSTQAVAKADHVLHGNRAELEAALDNIVTSLDRLAADKSNIPSHRMRFEIDAQFRDDLRRFADARETLAHLYGLQHYADVMSAFAAGERYLNRVWSASADGYEDEVMAYVDKAQRQFREARDQLDKARIEAGETVERTAQAAV